MRALSRNEATADHQIDGEIERWHILPNLTPMEVVLHYFGAAATRTEAITNMGYRFYGSPFIPSDEIDLELVGDWSIACTRSRNTAWDRLRDFRDHMVWCSAFVVNAHETAIWESKMVHVIE